MNLQVKCHAPAEVDATHATSLPPGMRRTPIRGMPVYQGYRFARVADPDGHTVNLSA